MHVLLPVCKQGGRSAKAFPLIMARLGVCLEGKWGILLKETGKGFGVAVQGG